MIETIVIDRMDEVMKLISDQQYNEDIRRMRCAYFYRGLPDVSFHLTTSLRMNCKHLHQKLEPAILRNFTKYAISDYPALNESVWKQMILGQHHGLPTRLMDWTYSPLIALHFANTESNFDKLARRDCVVWRFDMRDSNRNLPPRYAEVLQRENSFVFSLESLGSVVHTLEDYDRDMGDCALVNIEPPSIDQRIINQYSFFSVIPSGMEDIEQYLERYTQHTVRYIIKKELRWDIRDLLDQSNISERILYPGLDGLSRTLARHYFVRSLPERDDR